MPLIRRSRDEDIAAITAIYRHHVLTGTGTFEIDPPSKADMSARRADVLAKGLPYLVVEDAGQVLGFAYCNWFKPRPAYRFSAEDSIYMATGVQHKGLGKALLTELCAQAERAGVRKFLAVIGDSANAASIGVHRSVGFTPVGTLTSCGWKFDRWLDVVMMEKPLGAGDSTPAQ
ncbi:GNAT family N-acetyltransferase [Limnohabitans sp. MMS-10A-160]|uniref:GNAT family N-acetyltransferase n=1 Tax=unclassified Limnohabitans TaxID=2626134 RepID=UPI000D38CD9F|nr:MULTISPECIES: GNAT family N-acetyltransferase [unclassified Limnohabitans]PUE21676.1 GNAT family N-acetyltransferase [Limnohabitans sp. MMS-10A-192]PUE26799.1 GNAT family N-acetyltransferase [Limnohabitans sp. MMS-10A-160]